MGTHEMRVLDVKGDRGDGLGGPAGEVHPGRGAHQAVALRRQAQQRQAHAVRKVLHLERGQWTLAHIIRQIDG